MPINKLNLYNLKKMGVLGEQFLWIFDLLGVLGMVNSYCNLFKLDNIYKTNLLPYLEILKWFFFVSVSSISNNLSLFIYL